MSFSDLAKLFLPVTVVDALMVSTPVWYYFPVSLWSVRQMLNYLDAVTCFAVVLLLLK